MGDFEGYYRERDAASLRSPPTQRELDCLRCASHGLNDRQAAEVLGLSPHTVHHHWRRVRLKLQAKNRTHAVALALRLGLID